MKALRRIVAVSTLGLLLVAGTGVAVLWAAGWRAYIVHTGSMAPNIPSGDLVIDRPGHGAKPGAVITFAKAPGQYTTHRVAAMTPEGIRTKGDANATADYGHVTPEEIVGTVVLAVPYGGYVVEFFAQPTGALGLVVFLFAVWLAWSLFVAEPAAGTSGSTRPSETDLAFPAG